MTVAQIILVLVTVFLLSIGQILFKLAAPEVVMTPGGLVPSLLNWKLFIALIVYCLATALWVVALKDLPLRVAYPFAALAFFIVPTLAHFMLGETVGWNTYAGAFIIALGVIISVSK